MTETENETILVHLNFPKKYTDLADKVAEIRGTNRSSLIRFAFYTFLASLGYLSDEEKKALGLMD